MEIHVVKQGQTLTQIAKLYGITEQQLQQDNGLTAEQTLVPGQTLVILYRKQVHTVQEGETLWSIAAIYGITVRTLYRNNPWLYGRIPVYPGEVLTISYEGTEEIPLSVNGYAYVFINQELLRQTASFLTYVSPFTYGFTEDGNLIPLDDEQILQIVKQYGTNALLHLSTLTKSGNFSNALASAVLNNEAARKNLTNQVLETIQQKGYSGLDIDFEFVYPKEAQLYADFIQQLRDALNPKGYPVIAALVPKTSAGQPGSFYEGHNYKAIGQAANFVLLMTYEWGYTYGPPMAVAPLPSVKRVLNYAVTEISPDKIYMGMPNYGYDWTLPYVKGESRARLIGNEQAVEIARRHGVEILFDEDAQSPHFNYQDGNGREHEVWFEDARSVLAKMQTAKDYGFYGLGYWNLMRPFLQNWQILNQKFLIR